MGTPTYTSMGRDELIKLCQRLRKVVQSANPSVWVDESDLESAREWEHAAAAALAGRDPLEKADEDEADEDDADEDGGDLIVDMDDGD